MHKNKDLIRLVGQAKAYIDKGLCRIGPKFEAADAAAAFLAAGASRSLALTDAAAGLCRANRPAEALPLLRHLAEIAVGMNWVAACPSRAGEAEKDLHGEDWQTLWPSGRLLSRANECGMPTQDLEAILRHAADFVRSGLEGGPWTHVFEKNKHAAVEVTAVLRLVVRMMGHVLQALETRWPKSFPGAEEMWES